jgi:adhesin transport system membrane fusion protein
MASTDFKQLSRQMAGRDGGSSSLLLFVILLLVILTVYWAVNAELDNVTRGEGRIISSGQNQIVQAAEGGVILRRYVSENTEVAEGDILFEIDPIDASSELNRVLLRIAGLEIKETRLRAEIAGEGFDIPAELRARAPSVAAGEESLFIARRAELQGALNILAQRRLQREQDIAGAEVARATAERTEALLEREVAVIEPLVSENIAPETRLLELRRLLEQTQGEQERARVAAAQAQSGITEIDSEVQNRQDGFLLEAMKELSAVVAELGELREALPLLEERVSRTVLRAPVQGIVNRLNFRTPGGYIAAGNSVLEIVPTGEALIVEARILPQDISNIRLGDAVRIRLSAYDSSRYGAVEGEVTRISPDAVSIGENSTQTFYLVDVKIKGTLTDDSGNELAFMPGMTATVDVLSGKRTVFEYFWQPIAKTQELALRD